MIRWAKTRGNRLFVLSLVWVLLLLLITACSTQPTAQTEIATPSPSSTSAAPAAILEPTEENSDGKTAGEIAAVVASRTPVPTPTPGLFNKKLEEFISTTTLARKTFLGLTIDEWINAGISIFIVIVGYFVGIKLLAELPKWINQNTSLDVSDKAQKDIGASLKWLVLLIFVRYAVLRLDFLNDEIRTALDDVFFVLGLVIVTMIAIKLVNSAFRRYELSLDPKVDRERLAPLILMARRLMDFAVLIIVSSFGMAHFGININVLSASLVVIGLVLSFSAQDMIKDMISGFIVLVDQPFRAGDVILIQGLGTSGKVLQIGTRSTRIQTADHREVIIPNSQIVQSQVVNYTYPDPRYRVQTDIGVAYGSDAEKVRQVILETVRGVDGVLFDQSVDVQYLEFGDTARLVRVRWWIANYLQESIMLDKVNIALENALMAADIDLPFNTYQLNVNMKKE